MTCYVYSHKVKLMISTLTIFSALPKHHINNVNSCGCLLRTCLFDDAQRKSTTFHACQENNYSQGDFEKLTFFVVISFRMRYHRHIKRIKTIIFNVKLCIVFLIIAVEGKFRNVSTILLNNFDDTYLKYFFHDLLQQNLKMK